MVVSSLADLSQAAAGAEPAQLGIIGCGNLNRSDDGIGVWVVQQLQQRLERESGQNGLSGKRVRVFDAGTGGMDVMFMARDCHQLMIVDACVGAGEPGAIFDAPGDEFEVDYETGFSLHDFRWSHALGAGRKMFGNDFPQQVRVILIEAENLDLGLELTASVRASGERVLDMLNERIEQLAGATPLAAESSIYVHAETGNLYLDAETCARCFPGIQTIGMVVRDDQLWILPVHSPVSGGMLLKVRNARGDRVIHATEFLAGHGLMSDGSGACKAEWDASDQVLKVDIHALVTATPMAKSGAL